jgi:hypothetical protein
VKDIAITTKRAIPAVVGLLSLCAVAVSSDVQGDSESSSQAYPVGHSQEKRSFFAI